MCYKILTLNSTLIALWFLQVSELRQQLRIRGLPVSGTKTALMDRLRPFQDCSENHMPKFGDITTVTFPITPANASSNYQSSSTISALSNSFYHFGSTSSSPPISPASSDLSVTGSLPDTFNDTSPSFGLHSSPVHACAEDSLMSSLNGGCIHSELDGLDSEKDKMLVEKQKVINELTWKLQQEQRQVEELRMQLQKHKRNNCSEKKPLPFFSSPIKQEDTVSSCPFTSQQISVKRQSDGPEAQPPICDAAQLLPHGNTHFVESSGQTNVLSSTFLSPQCSPQHSPLQTVKSPQHISLPPSPNNHYFLPLSSGAHEDQRVSSPVRSQVCTAQVGTPWPTSHYSFCKWNIYDIITVIGKFVPKLEQVPNTTILNFHNRLAQWSEVGLTNLFCGRIDGLLTNIFFGGQCQNMVFSLDRSNHK